MTRGALRATRIAAVLAVALAPASARGADVPATAPGATIALGVTFTPRFAEPLDRAPIVGELDLHVAPDGKIVGFYRPESDRTPIPLSGGRTADRASFDVGYGLRDFHVEGRFSGTGGATAGLNGTAQIGGRQYDVSAAPCRNAQGVLSILCQ